jgi:sulfur carrier protein
MLVTVNGGVREVEAQTTVGALVDALGAPAGGRGVAVAVGGEVVPRSAWSTTLLPAGAQVEVLTAVQGG